MLSLKLSPKCRLDMLFDVRAFLINEVALKLSSNIIPKITFHDGKIYSRNIVY